MDYQAMDYLQEAKACGDVVPMDATLIKAMTSDEFSRIVEIAVKDVKRHKKWSNDRLVRYYWVQLSISGLMIEKGFMPLDKLQEETNKDPSNILFEVHTLNAFLGLNPNWKNDKFVRKWSRS